VESSDFCRFRDNLRLPPGLAFTQPNLPFLIQEIIGRLLALRDGARTGKTSTKKQKVLEGKTIWGKTIKIIVLPPTGVA
jgi:hypothetical protein